MRNWLLLLSKIFRFAHAHGAMFGLSVAADIVIRVLQAGSFFVSIKAIIFFLDPSAVYEFFEHYLEIDLQQEYSPIEVHFTFSLIVFLYFLLFPALRYISNAFAKISVNGYLKKHPQEELDTIARSVMVTKYLSCVKSAKDVFSSLLFFILSSCVIAFLAPTLLAWIGLVGLVVAIVSGGIERNSGGSFKATVTTINVWLNRILYRSGLKYWNRYLGKALPFDLAGNLNLTVFGFGLSLLLLLPLFGVIPPTSSLLTSFYLAILVRFQYSAIRDVGLSGGRFFKCLSGVPVELRF